MDKQTIIKRVLKPIIEEGYKAYFVGGCVRDEIMGIEPHDYDICTDATPEQLHKIFYSYSNVSNNSEKFGVTMPLIPFVDGNGNTFFEQIEIATFRKDKTSGRHPEVSFTSDIEEDASRRDFTINALYEDIDGNIIDPTKQGIKDAKNKTLRFVGKIVDRINEDPLRLFRFVRFLATKGLKSAHLVIQIEAISNNTSFAEVSKERRLKEFEQILAGKYFLDTEVQNMFWCSRVSDVMGFDKVRTSLINIKQSWKWHAEGSIFKDKFKLSHVIHSKDVIIQDDWIPHIHGNAWDHTLLVMKEMHKLCWDNFVPKFDEHTRFKLMLAAALHDIGKGLSRLGYKTNTFILNGKEYTEQIPKVSDHAEIGFSAAALFCKNLGMSNDDISFISELVRLHMEMHKLSDLKSKYKIMKITTHPYFKELCLLAMCDEEGCIKLEKDMWPGIKASLETEKVKSCLVNEMPKPILTGNDLIEKGERPSPLFRKKLEKALQFQIDNNITDKEELYKMVKGVTLCTAKK